MPGVRILVAKNPEQLQSLWERSVGSIRLQERLAVNLRITDECRAGITLRDYYPYEIMDFPRYRVVVDGAIYSPEPTRVNEMLIQISEKLASNLQIESLVCGFVLETDGDYVVSIFSKVNKKILVFNDRLGRLATYYCFTPRFAMVSREIKAILAIIDQPEEDINALVEYLALGYPLGTKSLFKDILRLAPSEMISIDLSGELLDAKVSKSSSWVFDLHEPFSKKSESIDIISELYLTAIKDRVSYVNRLGLPIVADLSGGFDTRAILGGLSRYTNLAHYFTIILATGDESREAVLAFNALGKPGTFSSIYVDHEYSEADIGKYLLDNDGLVNFYTTIVCSKDIEELYATIGSKPAFRFSGLGGEFIRHPAKKFLFSLFYGYKNNMYSGPLSRICRFLSTGTMQYLEYAKEYLHSYPEKSNEGKLKRWYYEYYLNFVDHAAEDRERSVLWTAQPLWSNKFSTTIFNRIPLNWTGYGYFTSFLKSIDVRLLDAPIYNKRLYLHEAKSLKHFDRREMLKTYKRIIKTAVPAIDWIRTLRKPIQEPVNVNQGFSAYKDLHRTLDQHPYGKKVLDADACYSYFSETRDEIIYNRLKTLVVYLDEVRKSRGA